MGFGVISNQPIGLSPFVFSPKQKVNGHAKGAVAILLVKDMTHKLRRLRADPLPYLSLTDSRTQRSALWNDMTFSI